MTGGEMSAEQRAEWRADAVRRRRGRRRPVVRLEAGRVMPNPFKARYDGRCPACQEVIEKDELLIWDENHQAAVHVDCEPEVKRSLRPTQVCPRCFMQKSASGACGCEEEG